MMSTSNEPARSSAGTHLARLAATLDRYTSVGCVALFAAILVIMVCQVAFRYVLNAPLTWTEELARYCFIWACYLGAPVATRRGNHVAIVFVAERLPRVPGNLLAWAIQAVSLVFFLQLGIQGAILAVRSHTVEAITLPIPWSFIYAAVPLSAFLLIVQTLDSSRQMFRLQGEEVRA